MHFTKHPQDIKEIILKKHNVETRLIASVSSLGVNYCCFYILRQLILKPYRIIYRVEEDKKQVSIARFWHASRFSPEL
ncbi:MAG: type II toxin-antitoxin system RelE/ParE family toxin [Nostoc sp.]|uniref:type II toxin-antitoxin system RelE/ParE family toxin n=1 Tax=Nostoc sp. TaxID=1180 RepID=UPI002FF819F1